MNTTWRHVAKAWCVRMAAHASTRLTATVVGVENITAANIASCMTRAGATRANMVVLAQIVTAGTTDSEGITTNALTHDAFVT